MMSGKEGRGQDVGVFFTVRGRAGQWGQANIEREMPFEYSQNVVSPCFVSGKDIRGNVPGGLLESISLGAFECRLDKLKVVSALIV